MTYQTTVPVDEEAWFATGDVGPIDDGILYITGRLLTWRRVDQSCLGHLLPKPKVIR